MSRLLCTDGDDGTGSRCNPRKASRAVMVRLLTPYRTPTRRQPAGRAAATEPVETRCGVAGRRGVPAVKQTDDLRSPEQWLPANAAATDRHGHMGGIAWRVNCGLSSSACDRRCRERNAASNPFLYTRGLPVPATGARAGYILERLSNASKPFGTTMEIRGETATITVTGR